VGGVPQGKNAECGVSHGCLIDAGYTTRNQPSKLNCFRKEFGASGGEKPELKRKKEKAETEKGRTHKLRQKKSNGSPCRGGV